MILTSLMLQNFRSYTKQTFSFSSNTTLVVGPNAAGKTNILEAIHLLATGKSFRADEDKEVVRRQQEIAIVKGKITDANETTTLELRVTTGEVGGKKSQIKKYLVNGVPRRQVDFAGQLKVVLFWPEHMGLVTASPSLRRKYLDSVLLQTDREYRRSLFSYERGLRQRNKLLDLIQEGKAQRSQLVFWNQLLIQAGGYLTDARASYIEYVNGYSLNDSPFHITYDKSVISQARLEQYADAEVAAKATLVGPHRDDFLITQNKEDLSKFGSRGQQRIAVLWLKMAELSYIHTTSHVRPVLLLDDIFSELDAEHRTLVMDAAGKQQAVLTSANEDIIRLSPKAEVISL